MTIRFISYEVYPAGKRDAPDWCLPARTFARAKRLARVAGEGTEINQCVSEYHSDGSSYHGAGGVWVYWDGDFIRDPRANHCYRRSTMLRQRPNRRGPRTPYRSGVHFSKPMRHW